MRKINFLPEQKLLNRIKSNDRTVLGELFVRYEKLVASYISKRSGDQSDAEDMLQEAIIVVWQKACSGKFELKSKSSHLTIETRYFRVYPYAVHRYDQLFLFWMRE